MKNRLTTILFFLLAQLATFHAGAQCTGCDITISSSSTTNYNLNSAQRICITGGTYTGRVTLNHSEASLCVDSVANYEGMLVQNASGSTVVNFGTWDAGNLTLNGNFENYGSLTASNVTINSNGDFYSDGSLLTINGNLTANKNFTSEKDVTVMGNLTVNNAAIVIVNGIGIIDGNVTNNNELYFADSAYIDGNLTNNGNAEIAFYNKATIGGNVTNNNNLSFDGRTNVTGNLTNNGNANLTVINGVANIGGNFTNHGTASGGFSSCGGIIVAGTSTNTGNYGTDGSSLDICDNSSGFDVNNGSIGSSVTNCECTNGTVLPIELLEQNVRIVENCVEFSWKTAVEIANDHFAVQRSDDGASYLDIAQVPGVGYSYRPVTYSFMDCSTDAGGWYRITQVDYDGGAKSYPAVQALRSSEEEACQVQLSDGRVYIRSTREIASLEVRSQLGQLINPRQLILTNRNLDAQLELSEHSGILIILVEFTNGQQEVLRFVQ